MVFLIIVVILFVVGMISLKYNVEGEGNPPFNLSKISVISNVDGTDVNDEQNKWNLEINQNNDIYLYIKKNEDYKYTETISSVVLNNFNIIKEPKVGKVRLLKPDANIDSVIFKNTEENETDSIEYKGDMDSSIKEMKVSNQGGLIVFRYAINDIGNYISNEDEEITYDGKLLSNLGVTIPEISFDISFDVIITTSENISFKGGKTNDYTTITKDKEEYKILASLMLRAMQKATYEPDNIAFTAVSYGTSIVTISFSNVSSYPKCKFITVLDEPDTSTSTLA